MSFDKIQQLVSSLAKTIESNEKLATPILAVKLAKCVIAHPHDQTIGMMSRVIKDLADHNTTFIRKAEFKDLYKKFYSHGSKFGHLFQEELGEDPPESTVTTYQRDEAMEANPYHVGDQVLANALESAFDKHTPLKM
jgi:hypothetical protein